MSKTRFTRQERKVIFIESILKIKDICIKQIELGIDVWKFKELLEKCNNELKNE